MGQVIFPEFRAKLEALIKAATQHNLTDSGRYFTGTLEDLAQSANGDAAYYRDKDDGELIELLWNNRREILEGLELGWRYSERHKLTVIGQGATDTVIGWEAKTAQPLSDGTTGVKITIVAHDGIEAIQAFEDACEKLAWQREMTPAEMVALGAKTHNDAQKLTLELTADTKAVQEMLRERCVDLELMEANLKTERKNADKLAAMLRYLMREIGEAGHEIVHQVMLLDTQTTLGDIIDGMLLQHDFIAAQREPEQ